MKAKTNFSFEEIALMLGVPVEEVEQAAFDFGLINNDGTPTEFAKKRAY